MDDSYLEMGENMESLGSPRVFGTLGSMLTYLHREKNYMTLKVVG